MSDTAQEEQQSLQSSNFVFKDQADQSQPSLAMLMQHNQLIAQQQDQNPEEQRVFEGLGELELQDLLDQYKDDNPKGPKAICRKRVHPKPYDMEAYNQAMKILKKNDLYDEFQLGYYSIHELKRVWLLFGQDKIVFAAIKSICDTILASDDIITNMTKTKWEALQQQHQLLRFLPKSEFASYFRKYRYDQKRIKKTQKVVKAPKIKPAPFSQQEIEEPAQIAQQCNDQSNVDTYEFAVKLVDKVKRHLSKEEADYLSSYLKIAAHPQQSTQSLNQCQQIMTNIRQNAYAQAIFDAQPCTDTSLSVQTLTTPEKIISLLKFVLTMNTSGYCARIVNQLMTEFNKLSFKDLLSMPRNALETTNAFKRLIDLGLFGDKTKIDTICMQFILLNQSWRSIFLEFTKQVDKQGKRTWHNTQVYAQTYQALGSGNFGIYKSEVYKMLDDPQKYLFDENIHVISGVTLNRDKVVQIYINCKQGTESENDEFQSIVSILSKVPDILKDIANATKGTQISLLELNKQVQSIAGLNVPQIRNTLQSFGLTGLSNRQAIESKSRREIDQTSSNRVSDKVKEEIRIAGCGELFNEIQAISKKCSEKQKGYNHDDYLCMVAANALIQIKQKTAVYCQQDTGNGKSFTEHISALHLEYQGKRPVIVVHSKSSLEDMISHGRKMIEHQYPVIMPHEIEEYCQKQVIFIVDEYAKQIVESKLQLKSDGSMATAIHKLGITEKLLGFSGHKGNKFIEFFKKALPNNAVLINNSVLNLIGREQRYIPHVIPCEQGEVLNNALKKIEILVVDDPVIVYAPKDLKIQWSSAVDGIYKKRPTDSAQLQLVLQTILSLESGILVLPYSESHSLDARFKKDAKVVIISNGEPSMEDIHQMISRGCRSVGTKEGYLYLEADQFDKPAIIAQLEATPQYEMNDAAKIWRLTREIMPGDLTSPMMVKLNKALNVGLRQEWDLFQTSLAKNLKNLYSILEQRNNRGAEFQIKESDTF